MKKLGVDLGTRNNVSTFGFGRHKLVPLYNERRLLDYHAKKGCCCYYKISLVA